MNSTTSNVLAIGFVNPRHSTTILLNELWFEVHVQLTPFKVCWWKHSCTTRYRILITHTSSQMVPPLSSPWAEIYSAVVVGEPTTAAAPQGAPGTWSKTQTADFLLSHHNSHQSQSGTSDHAPRQPHSLWISLYNHACTNRCPLSQTGKSQHYLLTCTYVHNTIHIMLCWFNLKKWANSVKG